MARAPSHFEAAEGDLFGPLDPRRRPMPRLGVGAAIRRHRILVALPVVVLLAAAVALGLSRPVTYSAESRVGIARVDVSTPGALSGYAVAAKQLTETYSRTLGASTVLDAVTKATGQSAEAVRNHLTAAPIPDTPVLRIVGTGQRRDAAIKLSNAGAAELVRFVGDLNRSTPEAPRLYVTYKEARQSVSRALARRDAAKGAFDRSDSKANTAKLVKTRAELDAVQARASALLKAYQTSTLSLGSTPLLQVLAPATGATNDRSAKLQLLVFFALIAGLAVGVALAIARAGRLMRRLPG